MKKKKVLIIEDDNTMISLLSTLLRFEGFDVDQLDVYTDITQIISGIETESPDLILLDVNLHNLDGFEILKGIRQNLAVKDTFVLMSSGMDFSHRCSQEGADDFILKPYMPEDLIAVIRKALDVPE